MQSMVTPLLWLVTVGATAGHCATLEQTHEAANAAGTMAAEIRQLAVAHDVPAAALVVVLEGQAAVVEAFGIADVDGRPADVDSVFRVASVSKVFTAMAAARLAVSDPAILRADLRVDRAWLRDAAPGREPVTLLQLLTHTGGFDDRAVGMFAANAESIRPLDAYLHEHMPRRTTAPGRGARYNNHGAGLAGLVVAQAFGGRFSDAVHALVLDPLGMDSTTFEEPLPPELARRQVRAFPCPDASCEPEPIAYRHTTPAGGLVTTPADMAHFMRGVLNRSSQLGAGAVDLLTTRHWGAHKEIAGMALALHEQPVSGHRGLVHSGGSAGFRSLLVLVPEMQSGIFVATSGGGSKFGSVVVDAFEQLLGGQSQAHDVTPLSSVQLDEYAGVYLMTRAARGSYERFPGYFLFSDRVGMDELGFLTRNEGSVVRQYGHVEGDLFGSTDGKGTLWFERDADDITAMHASAEFYGIRFPATYERLQWWQEPGFVNEALSFVLAIPVMLLLVWTPAVLAQWIMRRRGKSAQVSLIPAPRRSRAPFRSTAAWTAITLVVLATAANLLYGFGFIARFNGMASSAPELLALGLPSELQRLVAFAWVVGAVTVFLCASCAWSWIPRNGVGVLDRLLVSGTSLCAVVFVVVLVYFQMLPPVP